MTDDEIFFSLRKCLRQLNPNMILQDREGQRHKAKTWPQYMPRDLLKRNAVSKI